MEVQIPKTTTSREASVTFLDPLTDFYEGLLPLQTVEAIYADWRPDGLEVWLIVYGATEVDREQIYNQELALMQALPGLSVDTHLIDRSEVNSLEAVDLTAVDAFLRFPRPVYYA